ncbi:MAG TPA: TolC family protein [Alphaproteobacteria bacterium]|nr:TolC family protein [Alphaproteobacteria bacterium]
MWWKGGYLIALALIVAVLSRGISMGEGAGPGGGDQQAPEQLTLQQALSLALQHSPDVAAAERRLEAARALVSEAEAGFYPKINVSEQYTDTNNPVSAFMSVLNQRRFSFDFDFNHPRSTENFNTRLSLTQPLFNGGRTIIARRIARTTVERSADDLRRVHHDLMFEVTQAYFVVLQAQELVTVQREAVAQVEAQLALAKARFGAGTAVRSDVLSVDVRLAEVREELIKAQNRLALAQAAFNAILGIELERPVALNPESRVDALEARLEEVREAAMERRPEVARLRKERVIGEERLRLARAEYLPTLNVVAAYDLDSQNFSRLEDSWQVGVALHLNLFDGFATAAKVRQAGHNLEEIKALERRLALDIQLEAKEAFLSVQEARDRIRVAAKSVRQAEESLRIIETRYRGEIALVTELIDAQVALTGARTRLVTARFAEQIALARLRRAIGGPVQ